MRSVKSRSWILASTLWPSSVGADIAQITAGNAAKFLKTAAINTDFLVYAKHSLYVAPKNASFHACAWSHHERMWMNCCQCENKERIKTNDGYFSIGLDESTRMSHELQLKWHRWLLFPWYMIGVKESMKTEKSCCWVRTRKTVQIGAWFEQGWCSGMHCWSWRFSHVTWSYR